ncbi:MAG: hypothetical protein LBC94_02515 [Desulfovibrio sp.]|jgi:hypothetical protein|nr:hypothetical protein [Desulfovibrio sp.]
MKPEEKNFAEAAAFILQAISAEKKDCPPLGLQSPLFGPGAALTSLELVHLLLQVEDWCAERGMVFDWTSDSAMSANSGRYRSVESLARHIGGLAPERAGA